MSRPRKKKHPQLPDPVPPNPCFRTFPKSPFKKQKEKNTINNQQANRFERDNVLVQVSVCVCLEFQKVSNQKKIVIVWKLVPNGACEGGDMWRMLKGTTHAHTHTHPHGGGGAAAAAKTRLIKWKDSPLFNGTQKYTTVTDQNHTKRNKIMKKR